MWWRDFWFIAAGDRFCRSADLYQSLNLSEKRIGKFDVYDHYDERYELKVVKGANFNYELDSDWRLNLLKKVGKLTYYRNLIVHDKNKPFVFHEGRFNCVYSNTSYWVNKFDAHLKPLVRISKQGGHIVLEMKTTGIQSVSAKNYLQPVMSSKFCYIIDACRKETWLGLPTLLGLDSLLDKLGNVEIVEKSPMYG